MPNFKIFIVFISLVVFPIEQTLGQSKADSLLDLLKSSRKQEKITVLHQLTRYFISSNGTLALEYANDAIALAEELNMPEEKATAMKNRGNVYFYMGSYRLAEESYLESIEIFELTGNLDGAAKVYNNMGVINSRLGNYKKSLQYYQRSMNIKETLGDKQGIAATANNIGEIYKFKGDYQNALLNYQKSYELKKDLEDKQGMANSLNNLGEIYSLWSDFEKAIDYYLEANSIFSALGNLQSISVSYHNIGELYYKLDNYELAKKNFLKALETQTNLGDRGGMIHSLKNLGSVYLKTKELVAAQQSFLEALTIAQELEDKTVVASILNYFGQLNIIQKDYKAAIEKFNQSLSINKELGSPYGIAVNHFSLGNVYRELNNYQMALNHYFASLEIADTLNNLNIVQNAYKGIAHTYQGIGNYREAFNNYVLFQEIKDTLLSAQIHNQIAELETKYQAEQKEKEIKLKDIELEKNATEIKQRKFQRNALLLGISLVFLLALAIYRSYIQKQRANIILSDQKAEIEEKNQEITASIRYAKIIQNALLPHPEFVKELFPDSFIFYRPKDIVSGDFYWFAESEKYRYVTAVDATGHGVPGAFISLLGFNLLNTIFKEYHNIGAAEFLNQLNIGFSERMFKTYEKEALMDSMDLAICRIDKDKRRLEYAGAYNPLWIARNGEMIVQKADKLSIGSFTEYPDRQYTPHKIKLEKGDMVYLFSDGYADQFGGPRSKKFMYKQLKTLLLESYQKDTLTQEKILDHNLKAWKGDQEQIDDILIIGIRIT